MDKHFAIFHCERCGRDHPPHQTGGYCPACRGELSLSANPPTCICCAAPVDPGKHLCPYCIKNNAGKLIPDWK